MNDLKPEAVAAVVSGKAMPADIFTGESMTKYFSRKYLDMQAQRDALSDKGLELCREAAHVYVKYNATQMPDMDLVDMQTIQEFSDLSAQLRAGKDGE